MIDFVAEFHKQSRRRADPELIARWEFHVRYDGDKKIKAELAQARRISTQLVKACDTFSNLAPEQQLAFKAAASGMRKLASDLSTLALWAKDYSVFYQKERQRIRNEEYQVKARERWSDDQAKFDFECKIIRELRTREGESHFYDWLRTQPAFVGYESSRIVSPFSNFPKNTDSMQRLEVIQFLDESYTRRRSFDRGYAHASTEDYENYLNFRRDVDRVAALSIERAKTTPQQVKNQ
jgi:hypothetical protein